VTCRAVPVDDDRNPELPFPEDGLVANPGDGPPISGDFWVLLWRCLCGAYGVGKLRFEMEFRGAYLAWMPSRTFVLYVSCRRTTYVGRHHQPQKLLFL
jgi:hypothetical protein